MKKLSLMLMFLALVTLPAYAGPIDVVETIWSGITEVLQSIVETVQEVLGEGGAAAQSFSGDEPGPPNSEILPNMDPNG